MYFSCEYCGKFMSIKRNNSIFSVYRHNSKSYVHNEDIVFLGDDGWEGSYCNPTYAHRICVEKTVL